MSNKSFTLIEIIMAIFVITVGAGGAFIMIQRIVAFTSVTSSRFVAVYLSQEGVEIVRNIRDSNWLEQRSIPDLSWDDGLTICGDGCEVDYDDDALSAYADRFLKIDGGFYNYDSGTETPYKRKITVTPGIDILEVSVEVSWQERGRPHQVTAQTELHNWR